MSEETAELAARFGELAKARGLTAVTAESCTAGGIAAAITEIPGSSAWFDRGFVTYTAKSKCEMLSVPPDLIRQHGVVSEAVAEEMAFGAICHSDADIAVSVTGIAGPGGAEPGKPVGTVCIGSALKNGGRIDAAAQTLHFEGDRTAVREQTVRAALRVLIRLLESAA